MTTILDASALVIAGVDGLRSDQAKITFAIARHAVVDLAQVVYARYDPNFPDRLPPGELARLQQSLAERGIKLDLSPEREQKLTMLRAQYEPYAQSLARNLLIILPPWIHPEPKKRQLAGRALGSCDSGSQSRRLDQHPTTTSRRRRTFLAF